MFHSGTICRFVNIEDKSKRTIAKNMGTHSVRIQDENQQQR